MGIDKFLVESFSVTDSIVAVIVFYKYWLYQLDPREYFRLQMSDEQLNDLRKYSTMILTGEIDIRTAYKLMFGDER